MMATPVLQVHTRDFKVPALDGLTWSYTLRLQSFIFVCTGHRRDVVAVLSILLHQKKKKKIAMCLMGMCRQV